MKKSLLFTLLSAMMFLSVGIVLSTVGAQGPPAVEIEYWQYHYASKVQLVDTLIKEFEAKNPNLKVKHTTFPYAEYNEKVAISIPAGRGPDLVNLYYGWLPLYIDSGYLVPLSDDEFPLARIEKEFVPMLEVAKFEGKYWALPTAVRSLALFYNKDHFKEAGLDPNKTPRNWDELVVMAKRLTKRDGAGNLLQSGFRVDVGDQDHHWFRECLLRQNGVIPQSPDRRKILWNSSPAAYETWRWFTDLTTKHKVSELRFYDIGPTGFIANKVSMKTSGSFWLGTAKKECTRFNWGVALLPEGPKGKANFGSFWCHGITSKAERDPTKKRGAAKFLQFLTSPEVMVRWTNFVGELPARVELITYSDFIKDPLLAPFIEALPYTYATFFVDEKADREALIKAYERVVIEKVESDKALDEAVASVQKLFNDYWAKK